MYTIDLGDGYYSGRPDEEQSNLLNLSPAGSVANFTLNSNHEMYSGGQGYLGPRPNDLFALRRPSATRRA